MEFLREVGTRLREIRKQKSLTQEQVANLLHMSPAGYAKIERGETDLNISRLQEISKVLEINIENIVSPNKDTISIKGDNTQNHNVINNGTGTVTIHSQQDDILLLNSGFAELKRSMDALTEKLAGLDKK
jgi:transcriptional regulator with XRE-family HTH domain